VFGGVFSDTFLKGYQIRRAKLPWWLPLGLQFRDKEFSSASPIESSFFELPVREEVSRRRAAHLNRIQKLRPASSEEWFGIYPISMNVLAPYIHVNRRLFRTYEPFTSNRILKVAAVAPQPWKLNRRLFQRMAKPLLAPIKYLPHADGWMPYLPWYINMLILPVNKMMAKFQAKAGLVRGNQGPWGDWSMVLRSREWRTTVAKYSIAPPDPEGMFKIHPNELLEGDFLSLAQKHSLLQVRCLQHEIKLSEVIT
jgi:hypothetical protein